MKLPANATLDEAAGLAAQLPTALAAEGSGAFTIDASALQSYDTSTVALLLQAHRLAKGAGRAFEVVGAPAQLAELARLYGVEELLSLSAAVA
jgi:phospholipid transport system transporter-binding protein